MFSYFDRDESDKTPGQNKTLPNKVWYMIACYGKVWNTSTLERIPTSPSGDRDTLNLFPELCNYATGSTLIYGDYKITIIDPPSDFV